MGTPLKYTNEADAFSIKIIINILDLRFIEDPSQNTPVSRLLYLTYDMSRIDDELTALTLMNLISTVTVFVMY